MSVALFQNDDNFLSIGYWGQKWGYNVRRITFFSKEAEGKINNLLGNNRGFGSAESAETIFLKIERVGNQYGGYCSFVEARPPESIDDIRWTKIGTNAWINFEGKLALWADNSNNKVYSTDRPPDPPEVAAEFDFVLIQEKLKVIRTIKMILFLI